jgi:hypothetical protein
MKKKLIIAAALLLFGFSAAPPVEAADSAALDITVYILATKSLSVNTTSYDFGGMSVNTSSVSTTSVIVTNTSTGLIETYTIQGASATSTAGGVDWILAASTGTDTYALSAQFSTARPADADGNWGTDALTYSPQTCTSAVFGNDVAAQSGASVDPGAQRNLWFRIKTPGIVSDTTQHKATITLAVL